MLSHEIREPVPYRVDDMEILTALHPEGIGKRVALPQPQLMLLQAFLAEGDTTVERLARTTNDLVRVARPASEVQRVIDKTVLTAIDIMHEHPTTIYVPILLDAADLWRRVGEGSPRAHDRIVPFQAVRSTGTDLAQLDVMGTIPNTHWGPGQWIVIADGLLDKGAAIFATADSIEQQRNGSNPPILAEFAAQFGSSSRFAPLRWHYREAIRELKNRNILLCVTFFKNRPFLEELTREAESDMGPWGQMQGRLLEHVALFNEDEWIMGRRIDTPVPAEDQLARLTQIAPELSDSEVTLRLFAGLRDEHMVFRYGNAGKDIVSLLPRTDRYNAFLQLRTDIWAEQLTRYRATLEQS